MTIYHSYFMNRVRYSMNLIECKAEKDPASNL